jgi:hypothetical protein
LQLICCYGLFVAVVCKRVGEALCLWPYLVLVLVLLQRASAQAGATSRPTRPGLAQARYFLNFLPSSFLTTLTSACVSPLLQQATAQSIHCQYGVGVLTYLRARAAAQVHRGRRAQALLQIPCHRRQVLPAPPHWLCGLQDGRGCLQGRQVLQQDLHPDDQDQRRDCAPCKFHVM